MQKQVALALTLIEGRENEAAMQTLQVATDKQWPMIVAFALSVIVLEERMSAMHYSVAGQSTEPSGLLRAALDSLPKR